MNGGRPVHDDIMHFEFITLEGAQAGLSWDTVLNKRQRYREVFYGFDPKKVLKIKEDKIKKLLEDPGIISNKLKVNSTVTNAKAFLEVQKEFGSFNSYIWSFFEDGIYIILQKQLKTMILELNSVIGFQRI